MPEHFQRQINPLASQDFNMNERTSARMQRLHDDIADYLEAREEIPTGFDHWAAIHARQQKLMNLLGADETQWHDYRWQLANRLMTA